MTQDELRRLMQQIQVIDYELHSAFRIIATGDLGSEHISALMEAAMRRDRLMFHLISYLNERRKALAQVPTNRGRNNRLSNQHRESRLELVVGSWRPPNKPKERIPAF